MTTLFEYLLYKQPEELEKLLNLFKLRVVETNSRPYFALVEANTKGVR